MAVNSCVPNSTNPKTPLSLFSSTGLSDVEKPAVTFDRIRIVKPYQLEYNTEATYEQEQVQLPYTAKGLGLQGNYLPLLQRIMLMRTYYAITIEEMDTFLRHRGFTLIILPNVKEAVYSHVIDKNVCVRVYTGIVNGISRDRGEDAIRVATVKRLYTGKIIPIGARQSKVYRLENWKETLRTRIDSVIDFYYASVRAGV